ncbi:Branched-chain amino acid aminotransferase/4-amino-4-deoxychorismate lyase [Frankia canadensis]|uniref:Branched-chain amino acid aminotransferase/4-amino-4-deoxychorismate lyase n=1 Tax=Frankia canadensis TaxID=1836972 RepID=A0A2I2KUP1_9ACTN|nr:aminotransferase class IV [Frankia canadensis]SNQ49383.1 Branched-chain amino acid aminotransferase/4-amino-4-deoxychorismate lyase [Frankia canadensis]SOU56673.1 Branched-chain amino acid aminotransferase/4-amino-4-deoxychorismate lyase [Frankia canadensis]
MSQATPTHVEVDGRAMPPDGPHPLALATHGHFTVMQVRGGGVRGLGLHLARLDAANRELYGSPLTSDLLRARIRHALAGAGAGAGDASAGTSGGDATVRVVATRTAGDGPSRIIVAVTAPAEASAVPQRLLSVPYTRPFAHIKHLGTFGQLQYNRVARARGFDEALLTCPDGTMTEGATTNVGFLSADTVVWPAAPALHGVTMALVEPLTNGVREPLRLADLDRFDAAIVTNSRGIAPVAAIDDHRFPGSTPLVEELIRRYRAIPLDAV